MATLKSVSEEILADLAKTSQVGRFLGANLHTLTLDRIFTKGIASNGSPLGTYTPVTISIKKRKGRFTSSKVNLRDTGKLANSYIFSTKGSVVDIGFTEVSRGDGNTNKELKNKLEEQYGDIFDLTSQEEGEIDGIIGDFLDKIYR